MNNAPDSSISVVIPAYNNGTYISRSIDSVLAQTSPPDEIIVVDDGSTDDTAQVVAGYGDKVKYLRQDNAGASAARNTGIQAASGDWIALLDADDEWLPQKLQRQLEILKRHPDLVWITGNYYECLCDEHRRAERTLPDQCRRYLNGKDYYDSYFKAIGFYQWGHTDCMLIRKTVLLEVGLFSTDLPKANDIDMWLRIAYRYPAVGFLAEPLAIYHLSVADSIVKKYRRLTIYTEFMERHFQIARTEGRLEDFLPAASAIMRRWIRGMLFENRKAEIRALLSRFPQAFSSGYRMAVYLLTISPGLTAWSLRQVSRVVRTLKLRRRLTRRPAAPTR